MQTADFEALAELNRRCCSVIWNMETESREDTDNFHLHALSPRLIIPKYRKDTHRISEQEARFAFVEALSGTSTHYSVETPTRCDYSFTSPSGSRRAAQTDLTLHLADRHGFRRWVNVEFKADVCPQPSIDKDIEKLVREQKESATIGNWFHLLENNDSGTYRALFKKMRNALTPFVTVRPISILFCFCTLKKLTAYLRPYSTDADSQDLDAFFNLDDNGLPGVDWQRYPC